ncbi:major capsid protein [Acinetobacter phage SH-Ab 15599]|nr:major capsid protein [Acinetobacter phage SH-Ab 15599]
MDKTKQATEQFNESVKKWEPIIEGTDKSAETNFSRLSRKGIMTQLLENQENWCNNNVQTLMEAAPTNTIGGGAVATWAPVLIRMAKRAQQALISMDFFGTQPATTPDTLIFALRSRYTSQTGPEALFGKPNAAFSGAGADVGSTSGFTEEFITGAGATTQPTTGTAMTTANAELLGSDASHKWGRMAISIEKQTVSVGTRGLYADYTNELRQDLMAVHGENADEIISSLLVNEILAEMNREFITTMNISAKLGAKTGTATPGKYNLTTDSDGRWLLERLKALLFRIELENNAIAIDTRRGRGNRLLTSANVASALAMAGMLDFSPAIAANGELDIDPTGQTFCGVLASGQRVYIDPFADVNYVTVGYKGATELDAGIYYVPYTPLEMHRAQDPETMQPRMAFKTRYAVSANPFFAQDATGAATPGKGLGPQSNGYYRKFLVNGLEIA